MNKVILIGVDHHNGLGLIRIFGLNGIKPILYIVSDKNKSHIGKSKYIDKIYFFESEEKALDDILKKYSEEQNPAVIIPFSDQFAELLDRRQNEFRNRFYYPSINGISGEICRLMNKKNQCDFAEKYDIPVAKTWIYYFQNHVIPEDIVYPCILKPVASFEGEKKDIRKVNSNEELLYALENFKSLDYERVLIQQFLDIDYEILFAGCTGKDTAVFASKNIRSWPIIGGTGSYDNGVTDNEIKQMAKKIINALKTEGYDGLFDIEMFVIDDQIYLNEINWRNSGRDFMCIGTKVYYPIIWYLSKIGQSTLGFQHFSFDSNQYGMDEITDLRHVLWGKLSFSQWNQDRKRAQSYSWWMKDDIKPAVSKYLDMFFKLLCKRS